MRIAAFIATRFIITHKEILAQFSFDLIALHNSKELCNIMFRLINLALRIFSRDSKATTEHESTICFPVNDVTMRLYIYGDYVAQSYINTYSCIFYGRETAVRRFRDNARSKRIIFTRCASSSRSIRAVWSSHRRPLTIYQLQR